MNSKFGNLARPTPLPCHSEAMPKQPMFKDMGDAGSGKAGDARRSQKPNFEFISIYIIDVSGYIFRAFHALPSMTNREGQETQGLFGFVRAILKLFKDFSPHHAVAVFDGPDNKRRRKAIYPSYKATRDKAPEGLPEQIEWAEEFCRNYGIPTLCIEGVEADDVMGHAALWAAQTGATAYLCTSDKDLYQCVSGNVKILQTHKDNLVIDAAKVKELMGVLPEQIIDYLAIVGDASDNIPGVKGLGPKTASDLLNQWTTLDNLYAHVDEIKGKKQQLLVEYKENAFLSQKLVKLDPDVEVPQDVDFYEVKTASQAALQEFYKRMGFHSLVEEKREVKTGHYEIAYHPEKFEKILLEAPLVAFDCETTGLNVLGSELIGVGFSWEPAQGIYVDASQQDFLRRLFKERKKPFVAHNAKFDLHALSLNGITVNAPLFDMMLCSYVLFSEQRQHSLDFLSQAFLGRNKGSYQELVGKNKSLRDVPIEQVADYCCLDVDLTFQLYGVLQKKIEEKGLQKLLDEIELPLLRVLFHMEQKGIFIDTKRLDEVGHIVSEELQKVQQSIFLEAGSEFNISSPKQLAEVLFDKLNIPEAKKTASGQRSTSADVLEELAAQYPIAEKILKFRSLEKLRSTYIETLPGFIHPKTKRIHPFFNQSVAATGRLSCQDPNLQNIPIRTELGRAIRSSFRPELPGWLFLSADYSQIELRMLAHMSGDEELIRAFDNDEDIHAFTASQIFNTPFDKVTSQQRRMAKVVNFGIIYGQQAFGLSKELKCSVKEASLFIELYFARYPRVREFLNECKEKARQTGYSVTMTGRIREIPDINSRNNALKTAAERLAVNTPLQGSAADLIKMAMISADRLILQKKLKSSMILQIHDELLFEMDPLEEETLKGIVIEAMQNVMTLKVPLKVDIAIGKNWKECYA